MQNYIKKLLIPFCLVSFFLFSIFVLNQTAMVYELTSAINPLLGKSVLILLIISYIGVVSLPIILYLKLPKPIYPPEDKNSQEFQKFLTQVQKRLSKNKYLEIPVSSLKNETDLNNALQILNDKSDNLISETSKTIFVSTAISQNGKLDALMVLAALSKLVWNISKIYNQRPNPREMMYLYSNIVITVFMSSEIEDFDLTEHVNNIFAPVIGGSLAGGIPGVSTIANVIANSTLEGTANAFLTLRVGYITQQYFNTFQKEPRLKIKKNATAKATKQIGVIVAQSGVQVSTAILKSLSSRVPELYDKTIKSVDKFGKDIVVYFGEKSKSSLDTISGASAIIADKTISAAKVVGTTGKNVIDSATSQKVIDTIGKTTEKTIQTGKSSIKSTGKFINKLFKKNK